MRNPAIGMLRAVFAGAMLILVPPIWALDAETAVALALERDEGLRALEQRHLGLSERAVADGALPDPEVMIGAEGVPVDDPLGADMMTMYKLGVRQRIPAGRSRALNRQLANHRAGSLAAEIQARRLDIARQTRAAWLDWASARSAQALAEEAVEAFAELVEITEARYRAGTGRQRDIDQAHMELALLERRIMIKRTNVDEAASRLARWTGDRPPARWPNDANPSIAVGQTLQELEHRQLSHPVLVADDYRIEAGVSETRLARQAYRPEWMVEAGYAHARGTDPMTMGRQSDKLFAMVSFSVPLFTANRQDRRLGAARAELAALNHDRGLQLQEMAGQLQRQFHLWQRYEEQVEQMQRRVLEAARASVESTLSAYRADRASFDELVRARLALLDQQLELNEIRRARDGAVIELAWLSAEELP